MTTAPGSMKALVNFSNMAGHSGGRPSGLHSDENEEVVLNLSFVGRIISDKPMNKVGLRVTIFVHAILCMT